jgi:hypothetical protein
MGEVIAVSSPGDEPLCEIRTITGICWDGLTAILDAPLQGDYSQDPYGVTVQRTVNGAFVRAIVVGDRPTFPGFPVVVVDPRYESYDTPIIGGLMTQTFNINIMIMVDSANYTEQYAAMLTWEKSIRHGLFRAWYPTIENRNFRNWTVGPSVFSDQKRGTPVKVCTLGYSLKEDIQLTIPSIDPMTY